MDPGEYEGLIARAGHSTNGAIDLLQAMRVHKMRQPELVVQHGSRLLTGAPRRLGNDVWTVMEQVFLAAVEIGADDWRDYCFKALTKQFPASTRVERLKGILLESEGKTAEAKKTYQAILTEKPEDMLTHKRLIALVKGKGKMTEAVEELNKYLDVFSTDAEAWHELAAIYIDAGSMQRAIYCWEELLVNNKRSLYHILTYAELMYSVGDFEVSRKYYSMACYLDGEGNCPRALWGLLAVNMALAEKDKGNEKMGQLHTFTIERLKKLYAGKGAHGKVALSLLNTGLPA